MPPSFEVLAQRLRGRSKDHEEAIQRRLQVARVEVAAFTEYDFIVINDKNLKCSDKRDETDWGCWRESSLTNPF